MVYCLMEKKNKPSFKLVFEKIRDLVQDLTGVNLNPDYFISDFEIGAINAAREVFPNTAMHGCFFHLAKSVYRRVQHEHLQQKYAVNAEFSLLVRQLSALAFLPVHEINAVYQRLKPLFPPVAEGLLKWWEDKLSQNIIVLGKLGNNGREQAATEMSIEAINRGAPNPPKKRKIMSRETSLITIIWSLTSVPDFTVLPYYRTVEFGCLDDGFSSRVEKSSFRSRKMCATIENPNPYKETERIGFTGVSGYYGYTRQRTFHGVLHFPNASLLPDPCVPK
uniref:MULE transposase domain-containing protein n=1 Tax=Strigamia maritima TaxID=126957 RepID=T1J8L3_STRMM